MTHKPTPVIFPEILARIKLEIGSGIRRAQTLALAV
jgi:hypothetical protein